MTRRTWIAGFIGVLAAASGATGCASDSGGGQSPVTTSTGSVTSPYSLKIYAQSGGRQTLMKFGPIAPSTPAIATAQVTASQSNSGIHASNITPPGNGGVATIGPPGSSVTTPDASNVVAAAAAQCGMVGYPGINPPNFVKTTVAADPATYSTLSQQLANFQTITSYVALNEPWISDLSDPYASPFPSAESPWYIFPFQPKTCDQVLEYEETLLCVADKLSQLADAISPVVWPNVGFVTQSSTSDTTVSAMSWVIPPQAEQDKFIARDTAIAVLAHIPWLDSYSFNSPSGAADWPGNTCSALYAAADNPGALSSSTQDDVSVALYGLHGLQPLQQSYPPYPSSPPFGRSRLAFESATLRTAGQLLHDLVRESVYSDLSGAAQQAASAADPKGGQASAWGLGASATQYNSIGHAARVLVGRWELGDAPSDPENDPMCNGTPELNLINLTDPGTQARVNSTPPLTQNQATAAGLFESSGVVFTDAALTSADIRGTLTTQLMANGGQRQNMSAAQYAASPAGTALSSVVASLGDADLANAAQRVRTSFALMTGTATSDGPTMLAAATKVGGSAAALPAGGVVVTGGVPSGQTAADPTARAGAMMIASQCYESAGPTQLTFDETALTTLPQASLPTEERWMRQDVFAIAQSLRSRLVKMREVEDQSQIVGPGTPPDVAARGAAVAELGAWAGTARAVMTLGGVDKNNAVFLDLEGIDLSTFGATAASDLANTIRLVAGDPVLAECAANLPGSSCNATSLAQEVWTPTSVQVVDAGSSGQRAEFGTTGLDVRLSFATNAAAPLELRGGGDPRGTLNTLPLYIVATKYAGKPPGVGDVMGALRVPNATGDGSNADSALIAAVTLSPMRDELLNDVLGLGQWVGSAPPRAGDLSIAASPQYCVDGVPRGIFVPLENDLTNDSNSYENSWQHYLSLATDAANRADTIGQTWVSIGFNETMSDETAGEQLSTISGQPTNVGDLSVNQDGVIQAGASNGALGSILSQPLLNLVFFGQDPLANVATDATSRYNAMHGIVCGPSSTMSICSQMVPGTTFQFVPLSAIGSYTQNPPTGVMSYTALGLATTPIPLGTNSWQTTCAPLITSAMNMKAVGGRFSSDVFTGALGSAASGQWSPDPSALGSELSQFRMKVGTDGSGDASWSVNYGGTVVMDSKNAPSWPACLAATPTCDFTNNAMIAAFDNLFRTCPATAQHGALGTCSSAPTSAQAELNAIRWRVEGALWLLATMSGGIPEGMFTAPMPVASFPSPNDTTHGAAVATVFENGGFTAAPIQIQGGFGPPLGDESALGPISPIDATFTQWGPDVAQVLPLWLRQIYAPSSAGSLGDYAGTTYVHVSGSIVSGPTDFAGSGVASYFNSRLGQNGLPSQSLKAVNWSAIAQQLLDGQQCATPAGNFASGSSTLPPGSLQGLIAAIKSSQLVGSALVAGDEANVIDVDDLLTQAGLVYIWDTHLQSFISTFYGFPNFATQSFTPQSQWFDGSQVYALDTTNYPVSGNTFGLQAYTNEWYPYGGSPNADKGAWNYPFRLASSTSPDVRVRRALNSGAPNGDCGAAWEFTQAIALGCMIDQNAAVSSGVALANPPEPLTSVADLAALGAWLQAQMIQAETSLSQGFVESIPASAISTSSSVSGTNSGLGGTYGQITTSIENAILDVQKNWNTIVYDGANLALDIEAARDAINLIDVSKAQTQQQLLIQKLNTDTDIARAIADAVSQTSSFFCANPGAASGAVASIAADGYQVYNDAEVIGAISQLESLNEASTAIQIQQALIALDSQVQKTSLDVNNGMISIRQDAATINGSQLSLQSAQSEAAYYAGKAAGLGVWQCGSTSAPKECTSQVNTVLNRQYAGYELRYEAALKDAKAEAYIARLAIEQRIGMHLSDITTPVGPLDPPSTWADDVCSLTGVSYAQLSQAESLDAGTLAQRDAVNASLAAEFANGFIGDYVQKLSDFVEFYNVSYPEQDADGTAVVSLRENAMQSSTMCTVPALNLLLDSHRLYSDVATNPSGTTLGWQVHSCALTDATCMRPKSLGTIPLPTESPYGGVSWLVDSPRPAPLNGADVINSLAISAPEGLVSQAVQLNAGAYDVSWWDQARSLDGTTAASTSAKYRVAVYDASWNVVATWTGAPADGTVGWSPRRVLSAQIQAPGIYNIAFGASLTGQGPGSVLIANPQLELLVNTSSPSGYQDTNSSGTVPSWLCEASPAQFQGSFIHQCDPTGACYYQLATPLTINTQQMTLNGISISNLLATGNYNFRHIDVALNLVGTGVIDCSSDPTPACYANGSVQYTLDHNGENVGVLAFDGQYRPFNFGIATIDHGNALAAERYITTPVGSADQSLLQQPGILQVPFRGRPLDGVYTLKIYDSPALNFDQLQDIQIILNYHYWSPIQTPGQF
jgi:hypothetical protein